jgi:hypothetical protein
MFWCCCAQSGVIQCDSYISGYDDEFTELQESTGDGGWLYTVPLGLTPTIQPAGTLLLEYDLVMVGTPITFVRCAQWNTGITTMRYEMTGTWKSPGYEEADGVMTGASLTTSFTNGATTTTVAAQHRIRWDAGTGWRHQVVMFPDTDSEFAVLVGTPVQSVRTPVPVGPFSFSFAMELAKQPADNWTATAYWYGNTAVQAQPLTTPTSSEAEFSHGFALGFSVVRATIDRWRYQVTR